MYPLNIYMTFHVAVSLVYCCIGKYRILRYHTFKVRHSYKGVYVCDADREREREVENEQFVCQMLVLTLVM